jgi:hypothetical protein
MPGERGGENTSVEAVTHYNDRGIVFSRQEAGGGGRKGVRDFCVTFSRTFKHYWAFGCSERQ